MNTDTESRIAAVQTVVNAATNAGQSVTDNELWAALDVLGVTLHEFETALIRG